MTEQEIFDKYCDDKDIKIECFSYAEMIIESYSYKLFKLQIAIQELKQAIKDALFFWRK